MNSTNGIVVTVARKGEIAHASPQRHTTLRHAAEALSRRNTDQAMIELFMEALSRLVDLCYEVDSGGFCNIDGPTGKVLIPLPWGRNGHARWAIRPQESNILREIMQGRQYAPGLFIYDRIRRNWNANLHDFPSRDAAVVYLTRYPIGITEYRSARTKRLGSV